MALRLIGAGLALLASAAVAAAQAQTPIIDRTAAAARGRSVYIEPGTTLLTQAEARRIEREIEEQGRGPIFIAILPAAAKREADGTAQGVVLELSRRWFTTNPPSVYAAVVGGEFRAVNRDIPAGDLASRAFRAHRGEGLAAVLSDFVHRVGKARRPAPPAPATPDEDDGFPYVLVGLGAAAVAAGAAVALGRPRR